jgi:serine/threonine protein kinase
MGTPLYMSPEQWKHEPTDTRSDQFSFCVALFESLWGKPPFAGTTIAELSSAVLEHQLEPIPAGSDVPARVRDAVLRGLELAPGDRFPTVQALLDQLGDDPRASRRRRLLAVGSVLGLLVVMLAAHRRIADVQHLLAAVAGVALIAGLYHPAVR